MRWLFALLLACSPRIVRVPVSTTQDIRIVEMPGRSCSLPYAPSPPDDIELDYEEDDIIRRTTVNIRQHNALLEWARELRNWVESMNECMAEENR